MSKLLERGEFGTDLEDAIKDGAGTRNYGFGAAFVSKDARPTRGTFDSAARLSWVLAALAGLVGATAFTQTAGYFVTTMTGNTQRAMLGFFRNDNWLSITAALLLLCFVGGVMMGSFCRRHIWLEHPHGPTVLTTLCLAVATGANVVGVVPANRPVEFVSITFVAFGVGALNTSFVKDGEVSIPLSYVTGTLVKLGQGIERHLGGDGTAADWVGYLLLFASYLVGALVGGFVSLAFAGSQMLAVATLVGAVTSVYTYFHADRRAMLEPQRARQSTLPGIARVDEIMPGRGSLRAPTGPTARRAEPTVDVS